MQVPADQPTVEFDCLDANYTDAKEFQKTVLHEFGHVLGLIHTHQKHVVPYDEEKTYAFYRSKGWTDDHIKANIFDVMAGDVEIQNHIDHWSVML